VVDKVGNEVGIQRIDKQSIVSLKVIRNSIDSAREKLQLAKPLEFGGSDPRSLWLGPDRWLLISDTLSATAVIDSCKQALNDILHNAVDYSSGLAVTQITGPEARRLLATGTSLDLRPESFPVGSCCRTSLAQVAVVIVAQAPETYDVYVDRSYDTYLSEWLAESASIDFSYRNQAAGMTTRS
jgi:heterotetrameric sarcosine oxidase gamma subunit